MIHQDFNYLKSKYIKNIIRKENTFIFSNYLIYIFYLLSNNCFNSGEINIFSFKFSSNN